MKIVIRAGLSTLSPPTVTSAPLSLCCPRQLEFWPAHLEILGNVDETCRNFLRFSESLQVSRSLATLDWSRGTEYASNTFACGGRLLASSEARWLTAARERFESSQVPRLHPFCDFRFCSSVQQNVQTHRLIFDVCSNSANTYEAFYFCSFVQ